MGDDEETLLTEGLFSLVGNIAQKGLTYGFLVVATYLIAPDRFGVYVWALSILTLAYGWSNLNIYRSISYFVPQYEEHGNRAGQGAALFKVTVLSLIPISVVGVGIYWQAERIVTLLGRGEAAPVIVLLLPALWILMVKDLFTELFRGLERVRYVVYVQSFCYPAIHLLSLVVFVYLFEPTVTLALAFTVSWGAALVLAGVLFGRLDVPFVFRRDAGPSFREIFSYSLPLMAGGALGDFITQMDIILLGVFLGTDDPAFFRIALSVASMSVVFPSMFKSISKPIFSRLEAAKGKDRLRSLYLTSSRWGLLVSVPVAVYLFAVPEALVNVLFEERYGLAATVVPVLVVARVFPHLSGYSGSLLTGSGYTRLLFVRIALQFGINLVLDLVLIPELGIFGAAIGSVTAVVAGSLFEIGAAKYLHGVQITSWSHWSGLGSGVLAFATLIALKPSVSPLVAVLTFPVVTMVIYVGGLLLSGGIYDEDIEQLRTAAGKLNARTGLDVTAVAAIATVVAIATATAAGQRRADDDRADAFDRLPSRGFGDHSAR
jgi:O-antigen/teichoic acid export membrane protein